MARVDFYILPDGTPVERFACSITAKAWGKGNRVFIHTSDEQNTTMMDDLLWTFRDISFIPHERYQAGGTDAAPVAIGHGTDYPDNADVMINLDTDIPAFSSQFERIIEIVGGSEENKKLARQRYRQYRQGPHEIHDHHIEATD